MRQQPFSWQAYTAEFERDPDFDLFTKFSFDHLRKTEVEEIVYRLMAASESLTAESSALKTERKARERSRLTVIDGGAA